MTFEVLPYLITKSVFLAASIIKFPKSNGGRTVRNHYNYWCWKACSSSNLKQKISPLAFGTWKKSNDGARPQSSSSNWNFITSSQKEECSFRLKKKAYKQMLRIPLAVFLLTLCFIYIFPRFCSLPLVWQSQQISQHPSAQGCIWSGGTACAYTYT
jgi:hypothetical protein